VSTLSHIIQYRFEFRARAIRQEKEMKEKKKRSTRLSPFANKLSLFFVLEVCWFTELIMSDFLLLLI
jgi:hypothetical protein